MTDGGVQVTLLPCPFCNWTGPSFQHIRDGASLECRNRTCGASVRAFNPNAIAKCEVNWNARATASASTSRIRELLAVCEAVVESSRSGADTIGFLIDLHRIAGLATAALARAALENKEPAHG